MKKLIIYGLGTARHAVHPDNPQANEQRGKIPR